MDRLVHGVAKILTRLIDFHFIEAETFNNRKIKLATWDFFFSILVLKTPTPCPVSHSKTSDFRHFVLL